MDPTVIAEALAAGAAASAQATAGEAIKDAYAGVKVLLKRRFAGKPAAEVALDQHAAKPEVWRAPLEDALSETGAAEDDELQAAVEQLRAVLATEPAAGPKYRVNVAGNVQGMVTGDNAQVSMQFGRESDADNRHQPRFALEPDGLGGLETAFAPRFRLRQFAGDPVANLEWRFRGPRFRGEWRPASGAALDRTPVTGQFDLTLPPAVDNLVDSNEMGVEIRFHWGGQWRHELHRWPLSRRELPNKVLWDVGNERLPPLYPDHAE